MRLVLLLIFCASALFGEAFKLYLKDGSYQLVREYQVQGDRIHYYSTERSAWEDIPVSLVDVTKTQSEHKADEDRKVADAQAEDQEEKAERAERREIASIPVNPGAYYKVGDKIETVPSADYQVITDKKRRTLQMISPVPIIPGKASVIVKGEHATFIVPEERPSFYLRLAKEERFGIIRLTPKKNTRIVENIAIVPVAKQAMEERKQMDTFEQQLADGLYRVWPEKTLTPGEYALVEFSDKEDVDDVELLLWDFAVQTGSK
ncbi:MAG TPA: hypothetical protein VHZ55_34930 [Bryobacteraceae bacterium]|nr:hypothetical protein [Bryobacteraceae bacterium]